MAYAHRNPWKLLWDVDVQMDYFIAASWPDFIIINKKRELAKLLTDHRGKLKESEMKDKYLKLTRELPKMCNMKVSLMPNVIGALGDVPKGLIEGLEDRKIKWLVESI